MPIRMKVSARLSGHETRARIRRAFDQAGRPDGFEISIDVDSPKCGRPSLVRSLPAWVARFGLVAEARQYVLLCEPRSGSADIFPSQAILDLLPGRYMVETLDSGTLRWVSRESAEGGPLVAGLCFTGHPILVWIRSLSAFPPLARISPGV